MELMWASNVRKGSNVTSFPHITDLFSGIEHKSELRHFSDTLVLEVLLPFMLSIRDFKTCLPALSYSFLFFLIRVWSIIEYLMASRKS